MLKEGYDIIQCLKWQGLNTTNIEEKLKNGKGMSELIIGKSKFYLHFSFFIKILSLEQAIDASCQIIKVNKNIQKKCFEKLSYPIFIFFFALCMILFFTKNVIPMMMQSFEQISDFSTMYSFIIALEYLSYLIIALIAASFLIFIIIRKYGVTQFPILIRLKISRFLYQDIASFIFAAYYVQLEQRGMSCNSAYAYLSKISEPRLVKTIAVIMHNSLNNGLTLEEAVESNKYFSKAFISNYLFGIRSSQVGKLMNNFIGMCESRWIKCLKYISVGVQAFAYSFVGLVVLLVYQMMLMPLEMLNTI